MNLVSQSCTPADGIVVITTTGREYRITPQMLRAAYLAAEGDEGSRKAAAIQACKAVRGLLRAKPDHLFATHRHGRAIRDKAKELEALGNEALRSKHDRDAASDKENPFLKDPEAWSWDFDPATGAPDPASLRWEPR